MLPHLDRLRSRMPQTRTVYKGSGQFAHGLLGRWARRSSQSKKLMTRARFITQKSEGFSKFSIKELQDQLKSTSLQYRMDMKTDRFVDDILALLCEFSFRALQMRPYPVQIMGALVINYGAIAEMATGEGKSLTTGIGACLMASLGKPVHVLSSNDYLAARDEEEMRPLFAMAGFSSGSITDEIQTPLRKAIYAHDIVYTTGKEILGDFLRDRLSVGPKVSDLIRSVEQLLLPDDAENNLLMRGLHAVLVDEADSVLIDEAVTPLILSVERANISLEEATLAARALVKEFVIERDYHVDLRFREITMTSSGFEKLDEFSSQLPVMWQGQERCSELIGLALQAKELFLKDEHYVVIDDKIVLLDTLTGRLTPNRNLGIGLQQAVEAKENLEINPPTETLARFSYQKFFRLIPHLAGMTGTANEAAQELWKIYHLAIICVPTHRPIIRKMHPWRIFRTEQQKFLALVEDACRLQNSGQSVLIGTRTVDQSEMLAEMIEAKGGSCEVLNAVRHHEEADIIARAGRAGALTIATNMAGRGTDIKLTQAVKDKGGLCVMSLEPQDSARIDRQLFGRSGRQGDPGSVQVYASFEDALVKRFSSKPLTFFYYCLFLLHSGFYQLFIAGLQKKAEKHAMKQRLSILKSDVWYEDYLSFPGANKPKKKGKK